MQNLVEQPVGIIGGTGLTALEGLQITGERNMASAWGTPSSVLTSGLLGQQRVLFLARHGNPHRIPPHQINYRANIQALFDAGVRTLVGVNAVGGIHPDMGPAHIAIPDQLIDYTWGRKGTFFEGELDKVTHIDFTWPYSEPARAILIEQAQRLGLIFSSHGVYGATQGPRLETAAEIRCMERDGCDLAGMTGMPEAALAAELGMQYVSLCLVVNYAAGKSDTAITMADIQRALDDGMIAVKTLLQASVAGFGTLQARA
ncbi:S-methyl-5'-thioinosine phosphorylase [Marinobacter gelidimuriae]|uniref:S-methyl-5'-thioinosine phosphorylase n=1 Tax=Marinobacter gelidimuriae TaxID=2739064 RepID=UPI00035E5264|nr:S-methyl-5'-thioinosine phosphorylase [Marinobacter gelidimuriae]